MSATLNTPLPADPSAAGAGTRRPPGSDAGAWHLGDDAGDTGAVGGEDAGDGVGNGRLHLGVRGVAHMAHGG